MGEKMEQLIARGNQVVMKTYNRFPIAIECGNGMYVWDIEEKNILILLLVLQ